QAHVGDASDAVAEHRLDRLLEIVDVGDDRVDDDGELGPPLDGDVDVGGRADPAVDHLAAFQLDRLVDDRASGRALDRLRDRHLGPLLLAEDDPLGRGEVGGGDVELAVQEAGVDVTAGVRQHAFHVVVDPRPRVEAGGKRLGEAAPEVDRRQLADSRQRADQLERAQRQRHRLLEEAEVVGPQHLVEVEVLELRGGLLVEDLHHFVGRDAVGEHAGDEGAGAGADVDVEVVDRAIDGEQVESAQGADLVDAAGEAPAPEDEGGLRRAFAAATPPWLSVYVHNFAHKHGL